MEEVQPEIDLISPWDKLVEAIGAPGASPADLAEEAARRLTNRCSPGRPDGGNYSSQVEAGIDFRVWILEQERKSAESVYAAAVDDLDGSFSDHAAVERARAEVERLRQREFIAKELAPLGARAALEFELRDAFFDLRRTAPPEDIQDFRPTLQPAAVSTTSGQVRGFASVNDPYLSEDLLRKAELREAAREAARDRSTPYSRAFNDVLAVRSRIDRWEKANPKLASCPVPLA